MEEPAAGWLASRTFDPRVVSSNRGLSVVPCTGRALARGLWAGPGRAWMTYLRAGPGAGLMKVVGPGRARVSQSHLCGLRAGPGPNLHGPGPGSGPSEALF